MKYLVLSVGLLASFPLFAIDAAAARPCKSIVEACVSAGVIQSSASRQAMLANCVNPVVNGHGIAGVNIDPSVIQACKAKIAEQ